MKREPFRLPWGPNNVPHGLLDVGRRCNISCDDCYNTRTGKMKPLAQLLDEVETMSKLRKLNSISIIGGEPLLHPDLDAILTHLAERRLNIEMFTNGLELDDERLERFRELGVKIIFVHVEATQKRRDLPNPATADDVNRLRIEIAEKIQAHGIEAGLTLTSHKERMEEITNVVQTSIDCPAITYLLVTLFGDVDKIVDLEGDVRTGFAGRALDGHPPSSSFTTADTAEHMTKQFQFEPFAFLGSNRSSDDRRWLSYMIAVFSPDEEQGSTIAHALRPSAVERGYLFFHHLLTRRYPFYQEQDEGLLRRLLRLNGALGGDREGNAEFLRKIAGQRGSLKALRILFQKPAELAPDGTLIHCANCPDAVLVDGNLVPVCVSDRVASLTGASRLAIDQRANG